jgi:hypothetical protein
LLTHLVFIPLLILQWKLNNGRCLLTDLEYLLQNKPLKPADGDNSNGFVKNILTQLCKQTPSDRQVMLLMYIIMAISFLLSFVALITSK